MSASDKIRRRIEDTVALRDGQREQGRKLASRGDVNYRVADYTADLLDSELRGLHVALRLVEAEERK